VTYSTVGKGKEAVMFYMWIIGQFMQEFTVGVIMDSHLRIVLLPKSFQSPVMTTCVEIN